LLGTLLAQPVLETFFPESNYSRLWYLQLIPDRALRSIFMTISHTNNGSKNRSGASHKRPTSRKRTQKVLSPDWLKDFLSEMLTVETGGVKLYQKALNELQHSELKEKLTIFLHQTERHVELCAEMLTAAAGDSEYRSPGARAADHKANAFISTKVPYKLMELNNFENLVLAETKDHWNWEMLASTITAIRDPQLRRLVRKATGEVRRQEKYHLNWNEQTLTKIAMEAAMRHLSDVGDETAASGSNRTQAESYK
jgi:rubrerythrin